MKTPKIVQSLELETSCVRITAYKWEELMKGATRANKKVIDKLVKDHLPWLYQSLTLEYYNPYHYFKTKDHLILVHSSIEYFLKFE